MQTENDITRILVIESQFSSPTISIHKSEGERNHKTFRSVRGKGDAVIGVTHQIRANRAEAFLCFVQGDVVIIS